MYLVQYVLLILFFLSLTSLFILLTLIIFYRYKLKQKIIEHPKLYQKFYGRNISDINNTIIFLKFVYQKKEWKIINNEEILKVLKILRFIEFTYYLNFILIILSFSIFLYVS